MLERITELALRSVKAEFTTAALIAGVRSGVNGAVLWRSSRPLRLLRAPIMRDRNEAMRS
jgi:hypothetical protein